MDFSPLEYQKSLAHYEERWSTLYNALSQLCHNNPDNTKRSSVYAKAWIIGRTYATGIERKVAAKGGQGNSMSQIAECLLRQGPLINKLINILRSASEIPTPKGLQIVASVHGQFTDLLTHVTRRKQVPRSFASKYLHFHNPAVPIFDSIAASVLPKLVKWTNSLNVFDIPEGADSDYCRYVMRLYGLYQIIAKAHAPPTPKQLDWYLLWVADKRRLINSTKTRWPMK